MSWWVWWSRRGPDVIGDHKDALPSQRSDVGVEIDGDGRPLFTQAPVPMAIAI
jgi:hypothetical protein